jgi:hypothetical protein
MLNRHRIEYRVAECIRSFRAEPDPGPDYDAFPDLNLNFN